MSSTARISTFWQQILARMTAQAMEFASTHDALAKTGGMETPATRGTVQTRCAMWTSTQSRSSTAAIAVRTASATLTPESVSASIKTGCRMVSMAKTAR